jgi:drug/metabolite transporter (DMT)-like permease
MRPSRLPLLAAAAAAILAGVGNVAFSLHDGSQLGLAGTRFVLGVLLCVMWLAVRRIPTVSGGRPAVIVALFGGASPLLLILSAGHTSTAVFTLVSSLAPVLVVLGGRVIGAQRSSVSQGALAAAAVTFSAAAVLLSGTARTEGNAVGVALAVCATVSLATSMLAASKLRKVHPAQTLRNVCLAGALLSGVLAAAGVDVRVTGSTVAAALFIAVGPGGVAKAATLWATARTAPHLVAATVTFAVVPAAAGGALLLGQSVTPAAAAAGISATIAIALLVSRPTPSPADDSKNTDIAGTQAGDTGAGR